ncbi:MAG: WD40 repeat domain-containing protein [Kistimonas sp.]|nr:WD40 repeat domain-containing protein [Kistimonas sp.]
MQSTHPVPPVSPPLPGPHTAATSPLPKCRAPDPDDDSSDHEKAVLWSRLPPEMQDAVIHHLPLADIAAWQQVNRDFAHRIRVAGMREKAFLRALGHAFARESHSSLEQDLTTWRSLGSARPHAALSQDNYDAMLRPWLARFPTNPLNPEWPCGQFEPGVLFSAITRTLQASPHLALEEKRTFLLPVSCTRGAPSFSPDGRHLIVNTVSSTRESQGAPVRAATYIFSHDEAGWHQGSPFTQASVAASCICFAPDGQRVAVVEEITEEEGGEKCIKRVQMWEKKQSAVWQHTYWLFPIRPIFWYRPLMVFSPDGRCLALQEGGLGCSLHVWDLDAAQQWRLSGVFVAYDGGQHGATFSPDSRWLQVRSCGCGTMLYSQVRGVWMPDPSLESAAHRVRGGGCFRPDSQRFVLCMRDDSLSVWGLNEGVWREQTSIRHPDFAQDDWYPDFVQELLFSPDGQYLVTQGSKSLLLWGEDARGEWNALRVLNRLRPSQNRVVFDALSRWLVVVHRDQPFETTSMWVRDHAGVWDACPAAHLSCEHDQLASASDGQHLAALVYPDMGEQDTLMLLEFQQGTWVMKARTQRPIAAYTVRECETIAMDPLCCHLAVTFSRRRHSGAGFSQVREEGVTLLCVKPAGEPLQE